MNALRQEAFTDAELVRTLQQGPLADDAIRFLYRAHFDALRRYTLRNSGSEQDAEDIFQDVLVAFINLAKAGRFRGESSIGTFLFSLNKNIWLNELKRRGRAAAREERYEKQGGEPDPTADNLLELRQTKAALLQAVSALGDACRTILLLFYFENRSMKEILSAVPYENEQVVRNKKSKCLKKLESLVSADPALCQQLKTYLHG